MHKNSVGALRASKWGSIGLAITTLLGAHAARADLTGSYAFDIAPQPLSSALIQFSRQADVQVVGSAETFADLDTAGVSGQYTGREALQLLLGAHALVFQEVTHRSVRILPQNADAARERRGTLVQMDRVAYLAQPRTPTGPEASASALSEEDGQPGSRVELEEIVVTGTHIRGAQGSASPLLQFDRQDIERSGFATAEQFLQSLPQNFSGGSTVATGSSIRGGEGSSNNWAQGTGVNLRGLGNDATLVLLNGRRLAAVGLGNFVDLSLIPLSAIERIDVLTDGASAIYGSDAVGGVVNLITRKDYEGAETRVRYGTVTDGDHDEQRISQMLGGSWGSGSALLSYEYYDRSPLSSEDRYPAADDDPTDLIGVVEIFPPETRHGVLASLSQSVTDSVDLYFDGLYGQRDTRSEFVLGAEQVWDSRVEHYAATLGMTVDFGSSWQADIAAGSSESDTARDLSFGGGPAIASSTAIAVRSFDAMADGTLFHLPEGPARLAIGGHYRRESYHDASAAAGKLSRNVRAAFGELLVPLLSPNEANGSGQRLEVTLAGRYEKYSDFGSSTDPKAGVSWSPASGLNLRGTYGTSFRAPLFSELDSFFGPVAFLFADPSAPGGLTPTVFIQGGNPDLQPQQAKTWTLGLDLAPVSLPGLDASLTYFDIDFSDRIALPIPIVDVFGSAFLTNPVYASAILRNPDIAMVNALLAHPNFIDQTFGPIPVAAADIGAIVDDRLGNVAHRREQGVDFSLSYAWGGPLGAFSARLAGTYLLEFEDQVTPTAPFASVLNTVSYPVDFRMRNSFGWRRGGFGVLAFVNYVDAYEDVRPGSRGRVSSWTTVDLTLDYDTARRFDSAWLDNIVVSFSAQNLFDEQAPFAASLTPNGIDFDPTNATPLGRFIALQVRKTWGAQ